MFRGERHTREGGRGCGHCDFSYCRICGCDLRREERDRNPHGKWLIFPTEFNGGLARPRGDERGSSPWKWQKESPCDQWRRHIPSAIVRVLSSGTARQRRFRCGEADSLFIRVRGGNACAICQRDDSLDPFRGTEWFASCSLMATDFGLARAEALDNEMIAVGCAPLRALPGCVPSNQHKRPIGPPITDSCARPRTSPIANPRISIDHRASSESR
jgi:hypothetical protein